MSNGWDFDKSGDSGNKKEFTKFPVGVTNIRVLDLAPFVRWTHWMKKNSRSINCPGIKTCPICDIRATQKANKETMTHSVARRLAVNVYNEATGRVEIMEQGVTFFEDLRDLMDELAKDGKHLIDAVIKVKRKGSGISDTSYRLDIDRVEPLTEKEAELCKELTDLKEYFAPHKSEDIVRVLMGEEWDAVFYPENAKVDEQDDFDSDTDEPIELK